LAISPEDQIRQARDLAQRGETQRARQLYQALLAADPANQQARDDLAALDRRSVQFQALTELYQKGELAAVIAQGTELARQYPDAAFLQNILGAAHGGLEQWEEAAACYARGLRLRPGIAETHVNLGKAFDRLNRRDEAIACFHNALRIRPAYADAHYSLGVTLHAQGKNGQAVMAYQKAIAIKPDFAEAYDNLGILLRDMGHHDEAIVCFRNELAMRPQNPTTHVQLAIALGKVGRYPESNAAFDAALAIKPGLADARGQKLFQAAQICDWDMLMAETKTIAALGLNGLAVRPFVMLPLEDAPAHHRIRAERFAQERLDIPAPDPIVRPSAKPARIRIGYFSANFHNHAVMYLMAQLLEWHDRRQFEVHAYSFGSPASDEMRLRAEQAAEFFHDVHAATSSEIAGLARSHGIDIAIDLMGHTENARPDIFPHRAAPIQINYLGYAGTFGAPCMDYILADEVVIPSGHEAHYSEKIIRLPHSFMPGDNRREIADRAMTRREMGLPEQGIVFCCFNNSYKIGAREFSIWMQLLQQVEGSVLWLSNVNEWARRNLAKAAGLHTIDPSRIIFAARMPMPEHLVRHRLADLFLDTFHYNAHSTASDALWAALPVLTLAGNGFPARVAASLLTAIGLPELITNTPEEYARLALELARDPRKLAALKAKLAELRTHAPLFDTGRFARNIEEAYCQAYRRYAAGEAPADITVSDPWDLIRSH
jgi:protein O-GlcNAc transferase